MRFDGTQLAGHGEQCPRRNDIMNGEPELPQIGWRFSAQPDRFEQYFRSQFEVHGIRCPSVVPKFGPTNNFYMVFAVPLAPFRKRLFDYHFEVLWPERESL